MSLAGGSLIANDLLYATLLRQVPSFLEFIFAPKEQFFEERCVKILNDHHTARTSGITPRERTVAYSNMGAMQAYRAHHMILAMRTPVWNDMATGNAQFISHEMKLRALKMLIDNSSSNEAYSLQGIYAVETILRLEDSDSGFYHKKFLRDWIKYDGFTSLLITTVSLQEQ